MNKTQRAKALLNEIDGSEINFLWNMDYYDGPLRSIIEYRGQRYYTSIVGDNADDYRKFNVYSITDAEMANEEKWHDFFESLVIKGDKDTFDDFYERRKKEYKKPDLTEDKVIGYFYY